MRGCHVQAIAAGSRIPDPTTAGDFCRRFSEDAVISLMRTFNHVCLDVLKRHPAEFFTQAIIEADGTTAPTTGECKRGMNISYDGQWGYQIPDATIRNGMVL